MSVQSQFQLAGKRLTQSTHTDFENKLCYTHVIDWLLRISPTFKEWKKPHTKAIDCSLIHAIRHPYSADQHIVMTDNSLSNLSVFVRLTANVGLPHQTKLIKYKAIMAVCLYFCLNYTEWKSHLFGATYMAFMALP